MVLRTGDTKNDPSPGFWLEYRAQGADHKVWCGDSSVLSRLSSKCLWNSDSGDTLGMELNSEVIDTQMAIETVGKSKHMVRFSS